MRLQSKTIDQFRRTPEGSVVVGTGWLFYCVDRYLMGYAGWGVPTVEEFRALAPCLDVPLAKDAPPHVSLVDVRRLGPISSDLYAELARHGEQRLPESTPKVIRQVILPPAGYERMLLLGFREVIRPPYDVVFVETEEDAARMTERPDAIEVLAELARLIDGSLRAQVGRLIADGAASITDVARRLSLSPRTLQRRLAAEGTTFAEITRDTMVERAKHLLTATDDKLEVIARRAGYPSASHFTASFRRATGETPSAWRSRHARRT